MMLKVVILLGLAVASLAQEVRTETQMTVKEADLPLLPTVRPTSILRELPKPFLSGDFPWYQYPYKYNPYSPYHYQHYRNHPKREDGSGVAIHPGGATSYFYPQTHGVGKRSADPEADPGYAYSYISNSYHPYHRLGIYRYPYGPFDPYHQLLRRESDSQTGASKSVKSSISHPGHSSVHVSSPEFFNHPLGSYHGYSYSW